MKLLIPFICWTVCFSASAALEFHSERIKTMDIEVLQQIVYRNIKKLENKDESPGPIIKDSLQIVLAQPDQSIGINAIFEQLRTASGSDKNFAAALDSIVDDALSSLKENSKDKEILRTQNTYVYILNNMLAELQKLKEIPHYHKLIEKIRDADISFSDPLIAHRLLNSMANAESPSKFAATILPKKKPWWKFW